MWMKWNPLELRKLTIKLNRKLKVVRIKDKTFYNEYSAIYKIIVS